MLSATIQTYAQYPKYDAPVQFLIGSGMPDAGFLQKKAFISHPVSRIPCTAQHVLIKPSCEVYLKVGRLGS